MIQEHESDPNFLPTFISYFDGEKDPRNLMIAFSILQVPMTEWELGPHAQVSSTTDIRLTPVIDIPKGHVRFRLQLFPNHLQATTW